MSTALEDAARAIVAEFKEKPETVALAIKYYIVTRLAEQILDAGTGGEGVAISTTSDVVSDDADDDGSATHVVHHDFHIGSFHFGWTTTETIQADGTASTTLGQWQ